MSRSHNKKRNVGIIYELLLRNISSHLVAKNNKLAQESLDLLTNHFNKSSEIYKEFRLHSIVFALRSVVCSFGFYYNLGLMFNIFFINLTMIMADIATEHYQAATKTMRGVLLSAPTGCKTASTLVNVKSSTVYSCMLTFHCVKFSSTEFRNVSEAFVPGTRGPRLVCQWTDSLAKVPLNSSCST